MVADKVDLSLDDIIKSQRSGRGGRGRGRGSGRGRGRGGLTRSTSRGRGGPIRGGRGQARSQPYSRPESLPRGKWRHDMFENKATGGRSRSASTGGLSTGGHLQVSNLDFGVTEADIKELFSEFGKMKKSNINYDASGRSQGTADVVFVRKEDALRALKMYKGVPLDGRPMQIEFVTSEVSSVLRPRNQTPSKRGQFNRGERSQSRGRGFSGRGSRAASGRGGRGRGRGGRGPAPTKEDLDKELESYIDSK